MHLLPASRGIVTTVRLAHDTQSLWRDTTFQSPFSLFIADAFLCVYDSLFIRRPRQKSAHRDPYSELLPLTLLLHQGHGEGRSGDWGSGSAVGLKSTLLLLFDG